MTVGPAEIRFTRRPDGDKRARPDPDWTVLRKVHGAGVVTVTEPGGCTGQMADAAVTTVPGARLAVLTADCAPVVLVADGVLGVVHAGWRGLRAGVVEAAAARMRELGAARIEAVLGPCIHAECYEFVDVADRFDDEDVRGTTKEGTPALDLPAAVRAALRRADVELVHDEDACTACEAESWFSHRARGEDERQATVAWMRAS